MPPPTDLALTISRKQFEAKALHLLKLARSALVYLSVGVGFEEQRREEAAPAHLWKKSLGQIIFTTTKKYNRSCSIRGDTQKAS